jgi:hypothetical protein
VEERISRQQKNIVLDTQQGWQMMKPHYSFDEIA